LIIIEHLKEVVTAGNRRVIIRNQRNNRGDKEGAMTIVLNLTEENIRTVRKARAFSDRKCRRLAEKEDRKGLSDAEVANYTDWLDRNALLIRMEAIIDDRMIEAEEKRKETEMKISAEMNDGKMDINLSVDENDLKNADALTEFIDELRKAVTELKKLGASS
jgi:hypothetical protein